MTMCLHYKVQLVKTLCLHYKVQLVKTLCLLYKAQLVKLDAGSALQTPIG